MWLKLNLQIGCRSYLGADGDSPVSAAALALTDFLLTEKDFISGANVLGERRAGPAWVMARPSERCREVPARVVARRPFFFQMLYFGFPMSCDLRW